MRKSILPLAFLAMLAAPLASTADTISGVLSVTGTIEISNDSIAFAGNQFSVNSPASSQQGGFTALAGTTGTIHNITDPPYAPGVIFPTPDFMTFSVAPNITFTLLELEAGSEGAANCTAPPAGGQVCTRSVPSLSPFNLINLSPTSSIASFSILGDEVDSLTGTSTAVTGVFTVPLADENFQNFLATVAAGGTITSSFAAQFTTDTSSVPPVPEPGTFSMMAMGMLAIGMLELVWFRRTRFTAGNSTAI